MLTNPDAFGPEFLTIHPHSRLSIGPQLKSYAATGTTSTAWVANLGIFVPFHVPRTVVIGEVFWVTGTGAATGNVDLGIFQEDGTMLTSTGALGRGSASTLTRSGALTDYNLPRGSYYMAISGSSTDSLGCFTPAAGLFAACGVMEETTSYPLSTATTLAATTRAFVPMFGLSVRAIQP